MMSEEEANEMLAKMNGNIQDNNKETETKVEEPVLDTKNSLDETEQPKENVDKNKSQVPENPEKKIETEDKPQSDVKKSEDKVDGKENNEKKSKYSHQEQIDFAFKKLQAKNKAKYLKALDRIKELEKENSELKKKNLDDFGGNLQAYADYSVDQKIKDLEKKRLEEEVNEYQIAEYNEINNRRISNCFPDEHEQKIFYDLLRTNGGSFDKTLSEKDPENVVLGFLDDSEVSPILLRILMTDENWKNSILNKRNPYARYDAIKNLEQRVIYAQKQLSESSKSTTKTPIENKTNIPVVGSVTKSENFESKPVFDENTALAKMNKHKSYM